MAEDAFGDLNEIEGAFNADTNRVKIVVLIDMADTNDTRAYDIRNDPSGPTNTSITSISIPLSSINSNWVDEVDMGDPQTVIDFVLWGISAFPSSHYGVILWDHGSGWLKKMYERIKGICWDYSSGYNYIDSKELRDMFETIYIDAGSTKVDFVGLDACYMGMIEVFYQLYPYVDIGIGSEEAEPNDGWEYRFIEKFTLYPDMPPESLSNYVVRYYYNSYTDGQPDPDDTPFITQSAIDINLLHAEAIPEVNKLAKLLYDNMYIHKSEIDQAQKNSQHYFLEPSYKDLYDFASNLIELDFNTTISEAADSVIGALERCIIAEAHGSESPGSHGLSIYFEADSSLYDTRYDGSTGFLLFTQMTYWDEMLKMFYNPRQVLVIEHEPLKDSEDTIHAYPVIARIITATPLITDSLLTYYRINKGNFISLNMSATGDTSEYQADIPPQSYGTTIDYYIFAVDSNHTIATHPYDAPANYHSFYVGLDTIPPIITHTPIKDYPIVLWPAKVTAFITDNLGVDTVFVRYKKNGITEIPFGLEKISDSEYEGYFNCTADTGDVIEYQIVAVDKSIVPDTAYHPTDGYHLFAVTPIKGTVLVIDDDDGEGSKVSRNSIPRTHKIGESANAFKKYLEELGYVVEKEKPSETDTSTWQNYNFICWSSGADVGPVSDESYRLMLEDYILAKRGKLLIEGGELSWVADSEFATNVLHIEEWVGDSSGSLILKDETHPIASIPNTLPATIDIDYNGWGDQDAVLPASDAYIVYTTRNYRNAGGIITYDNTYSPQGGQLVFYAFNLMAIADSVVRKQLIENTAHYLITNESPPNGEIRGYVHVAGSNTNGNVVVTATCVGYSRSSITNADGSYEIDSLYPGIYKVTAYEERYADSTVTGVLVEENSITYVNFTIYPLVMIYCENFDSIAGEATATGNWQWGRPTYGPDSAHSVPNLWATNLNTDYSPNSNSTLDLPDVNLAGLTNATLEFWHWYIMEREYDGGNVKVSVDGAAFQVITPEDGYDIQEIFNEVMLGEPAYSDFMPYWRKVTFDLSEFVNHSIRIRFHFGSDFLEEFPGWYIDDVKIYYVNYLAGIESSVNHIPKNYFICQSYPNPTNSSCTIKYGIPKDCFVKLNIYNVVGQRVISLVNRREQAGFKLVSWDCRDEEGKLVAPGIYFYRLQTKEYKETRKLIIVR